MRIHFGNALAYNSRMNYRAMTVQELELLWDLGRQGSLRALGRANGLQPSHVSKILARIEKKLGTSVVQRSAKGVVLTPDGIRLVAVAEQLVESARQLSLAQESRLLEPVPVVSIAASRFVCNDLIAPALEELRGQNRFRFRLLDMAPDQVEAAALKSACELAIVEKATLSKAWEVRKLGLLTWGLFASGGHPLPDLASEYEVLQFPFAVPNYWTGKAFEVGNDQCPVEWNRRIRGDETSSIATAIRLVTLSPTLLVFAPRIAVQEALSHDCLREIHVKSWPQVSRSVSLAARADRVPQRLYRDLIQALKARLV